MHTEIECSIICSPFQLSLSLSTFCVCFWGPAVFGDQNKAIEKGGGERGLYWNLVGERELGEGSTLVIWQIITGCFVYTQNCAQLNLALMLRIYYIILQSV